MQYITQVLAYSHDDTLTELPIPKEGSSQPFKEFHSLEALNPRWVAGRDEVSAEASLARSVGLSLIISVYEQVYAICRLSTSIICLPNVIIPSTSAVIAVIRIIPLSPRINTPKI